MKVPSFYEGRVVVIHLARPVYLCEYAAHVKLTEGEPMLMVQPIVHLDPSGVKKMDMTELLVGAIVESVQDDSVIVKLLDPSPDGKIGNIMRKLVPSALILSIDDAAGFEVEMPQATRQVREVAPASKIVMP